MLVIQPTHGATRRVELVKNLDDPIFAPACPQWMDHLNTTWNSMAKNRRIYRRRF